MPSLQVLLCDDNQDNAEVLETLLSKRGFIVQRLRDFSQLRQALNTGKPDLLLLDMCLPEVDVIAELKAAVQLGIPVIAFSGMPEWKQDALDAGALLFLVKPFRVRDILEAMHKLLPSWQQSS